MGNQYTLWGTNSGQKIMQKRINNSTNQVKFLKFNSNSYLLSNPNSKYLNLLDILSGNLIKNLSFEDKLLDFTFFEQQNGII